jgi:hypothetical protein
MKTAIKIIMAVTMNCILGGILASIVGIAPVFGAVGLNAIAALPLQCAKGALRAGLYPEIWTGEMIKAFRTSMESVGWLSRIKSYDQYTKNNIINFVDIGGDPTVLINNTTYPLAIESLTDANKPVSLDKYQTKPTKITDDELHGLSYDKIGSVVERHTDVIAETKYKKALHSLAPNENTDNTPVILTTGDVSADKTRKKMKAADIIQLKQKFDKLKVPLVGRILVLAPEHVSDLLEEDRVFSQQYNNYTTGKIANMYGFEVYEYVDTPSYTVSSLKKLAYGSVATSTERNASIAFYAPRMMKATGETKVYLQDASVMPTTQENIVSYRHYFIALPLRDEAIGAIVSNINS